MLSRLLLLVVFLAACHRAKQGEPCKQGDNDVCKDEESALVCMDGKWETVPCGTCKGKGRSFECTPTPAVEGAACFGGLSFADEGRDSGNYRCSNDGTWLLNCTGSGWKKKRACKCIEHSRYIRCDPPEPPKVIPPN